jgi:hypothetical protein
MRCKSNTVFFDFDERGEAVDLKSSAVGENGLVPRDKFMQSSQLLDNVSTRPQKQMIRIDQHELGAGLG